MGPLFSLNLTSLSELYPILTGHYSFW